MHPRQRTCTQVSSRDKQEKGQVPILGAGYAGLYAALELEKTLAGNPAIEVTLDVIFTKDFVRFETTKGVSIGHEFAPETDEARLTRSREAVVS